MSKNTQFIGVDISKDKFDVWHIEKGHRCYRNNRSGFEEFDELLNELSWVVMEATGSYYQRLALYLHEKGIRVSVVNPLIIKRFIQMKLHHNKNDKADAQMICRYACEQPLKEWHPEPQYIEQSKILYASIELYFKQATALKNKRHSLESKGGAIPVLVRSINRQIKHLEQEIRTLEEALEALIKEYDGSLLTNLISISGIGKKTALLLIAHTNGFRTFENYRQVIAFFGMAPMERTSGSSVRGVSRISKRGNPMVRNHLFLCSFTACMYNSSCKALYERITAKGKSKKLALIAVCNKLLKQAFAISQSGIPYDPMYKSKLSCN